MESMLDVADRLKLILVNRATGELANEPEFRELRTRLFECPRTRKLLPRFLHSCRTLGDFWGHIKLKFPTYQARREYLREEFQPLFSALEGGDSPVSANQHRELLRVDRPYVREAWNKAVDRCNSGDHDGAITAARTLIETVCKHVLDESGIQYPHDLELPELHRKTCERMELAPSQQAERELRQICGACAALVEGVGSLRNRFSDSHGKGIAATRLGLMHAELAVNVAGSLATFLLEAWTATTIAGSAA